MQTVVGFVMGKPDWMAFLLPCLLECCSRCSGRIPLDRSLQAFLYSYDVVNIPPVSSKVMERMPVSDLHGKTTNANNQILYLHKGSAI